MGPRSGLLGWLGLLSLPGPSWGACPLIALWAWPWACPEGACPGSQEEPEASFAECSFNDLMTGSWLWRALALTCSLEMAREQYGKSEGGQQKELGGASACRKRVSAPTPTLDTPPHTHTCGVCCQWPGWTTSDAICLFCRFVFGLDQGKEKSRCRETLVKLARV